MEFDHIPVDEESRRFKKHLELPENKRILFSGIFGIGKTYFLDQFFSEYSEEYVALRINPVNYSVSQNEDIFELIKYDIAFQLLSTDIKFESLEFDTKLFSEFYFVENFQKVVRQLISSLSKIDQRVDAIVAPSLALAEKMKEEKEKLEENEKLELQEFFQSFYNTKGSIREENHITTLINHLIEGLKEKNRNKKVILVIDDLDRIDPDHIFRILNVFSAHFDFLEIQNKFDFDQVLLVCDVENIRGIFHNKYGTNIDFSGYIDKFYSTNIFSYNFKKILTKHLWLFLRKIKLNDEYVEKQLTSSNPDEYLRDELSHILTFLVLSNSLNMRILVNFIKNTHNIKSYSFYFGGIKTAYSRSTPIIVIFELLSKISGSEDNFLDYLCRTASLFPTIDFEPYNPWWQQRLGNLIMLIDGHKNKLQPSRTMTHYVGESFGLEATYFIYSSPLRGVIMEINSLHGKMELDPNISNPVDQLKKTKIPYFQMMKEAFLVFRSFKKE